MIQRYVPVLVVAVDEAVAVQCHVGIRPHQDIVVFVDEDVGGFAHVIGLVAAGEAQDVGVGNIGNAVKGELLLGCRQPEIPIKQVKRHIIIIPDAEQEVSHGVNGGIAQFGDEAAVFGDKAGFSVLVGYDPQ